MTDLRESVRWRIDTEDDPAAGQNLLLRVPGQEIIVPVTAAFTLVTDANVGNRVATIAFDDGERVYHRITATAVQAASTTRNYALLKGTGGTGAGTVLALHDASVYFPMEPGHRLTVTIEGIQAGDQISDFVMRSVVFPTGPLLTPIPFAALLAEPRMDAEQMVPAMYSP